MKEKSLHLNISINSIKIIGGALLAFTILMVFILFGLTDLNGTKNEEGTINDEITKVYRNLNAQAQALYYRQSEELTKPVPARLVELDQLSIGCFGPASIMSMADYDTNLGGQCCGVLMDSEAYELQLVALEEFITERGKGLELIPTDPYDIEVRHAKQLIKYDEIRLTGDEEVYERAMEMSHHGGPCCCKCWKWYMMSGLAKKLITEYSWNSEDIAQLWDLSSSCGHSEDTNMPEHYKDD